MYAHLEKAAGRRGHSEDGPDPRAAGQPGLLGSVTFRQLAGSAGVCLTLWQTEAGATAYLGQRAGLAALPGEVYEVTAAEDGPASAQAPAWARLMYFDGPRAPEQAAAADQAGRQRIWPAISGLSGLVGAYVLHGRDLGAVIITLTTSVTTPGGHCHYLGGAVAPTCEGVRAAVREHASRGVDVIKIMASGGNLTPGSRQDLAQFPPEVLRAAVDEAHRLGLPVTAHAHAVAAIADAVAAGVDGLEHVSFWTEEGVDAPAGLIRLIAARQIAVGATLGMVPVPGMAPPPAVAMRMPAMTANSGRLYQEGAVMVAGTDAGIAPVKPHDVLRYAPVMLCQLGFSPAEALRAVTSTAAAVCGLGQRKGRIAPGFDADILAVDGDPVADLEALHRIRAVYARGTAVARPGG